MAFNKPRYRGGQNAGRVSRNRKKAQATPWQGVYTEGDAGAYQKEANELLSGAYTVLDDFGYSDSIRGIYYKDRLRGDAYAYVDGMNDLYISKATLKNGYNDTGYNVSATHHGTGTHEAGHIVVRNILRTKVMPNASRLEKAVAGKKNKLEHEIIKEATKRFGSNPRISKYGSTNVAEKIAEAVSDVYTNGSRANAYSKVIVDVMKDANSGTFKPKITITKRELDS